MRSYSCSKELYLAYLLASCIRYSGLALSEVSPTALSHDAVSRWLKNKRFSPKDVWSATRDLVDLDAPCLLLADDSVLDKRHSRKIETVGYQYSGNAHDVIAGIGMVNMVWCPTQDGEYLPVDFRIYDKDSDGKTKNSHFRDMLKVAKTRGFKPDAVVMDAWYSSLDNLKSIRSLGWNWVCGLRKNRIVNRNQSLQNIEIPDEGAKVHLRGYGWVHVFRFETSERRTDYIATSIDNPTRDGIKTIMKARWKIEVFHRELKQTCAIERCQSRSGRAQRNHICIAVLAWVERFKRRMQDNITFYGQQWENVKPVITQNIRKTLMTSP